MNRNVRLVAEGIDVTASDAAQAERYLREDAAEFSRDWNYALCDVTDSDDDVAEDAGDARIEVEVDEPPGRGERVWNGRAFFEVVVAPQDDDAAFASAKALLAA